ncbi:unnamed protein product [Linum trigynum]|uniref:Uncharacterized protein n=1 Tax=Linum trigynum TaxID=586398 RepID=A0AAV2FVQ6_9ROSI
MGKPRVLPRRRTGELLQLRLVLQLHQRHAGVFHPWISPPTPPPSSSDSDLLQPADSSSTTAVANFRRATAVVAVVGVLTRL